MLLESSVVTRGKRISGQLQNGWTDGGRRERRWMRKKTNVVATECKATLTRTYRDVECGKKVDANDVVRYVSDEACERDVLITQFYTDRSRTKLSDGRTVCGGKQNGTRSSQIRFV